MLKKYLYMCAVLFSSFGFSQANTATEPNIIFFIVDDLGYYDLEIYNDLLGANATGLYETPNIDAMANQGVMFTHAYEAAPRCAASRTSIMTGKFESRPSVTSGLYLPADNHPDGYAETTWAQALKNEGYKTFFIGKWHLGHDANHYPDSFGFDINLGGSDVGAPNTYWHPYANEMNDIISPPPAAGLTIADGTTGDYLTDRITAVTNNFISTHVTNNPTQPFLAMVSHYGVHTPLEAKAADVTTFQNKVNNITYTGPEFENDLTAKTRLHQNNATYAAMIKSIDESLGSIRAQLTSSGIADNTVIILTSDNGGLSTTEIGGNRELPTSNRPFRGGKTWLFEGGVRLPLIVYGPSSTFRSNTVVDTPVVGTDFFPTILELGNAPLLPAQHLDGESFKDLLVTSGNASFTRTNPIIWDFNFASSGTANVSMAGARQGNFKLLEFKYNNVFELYDVVNDPGETTDLSGSNPAIVEQLKNAIFSYRSNAGITHRVTNSGQIAENEYLYNNMNAQTGSNIQPSFGCAEPSAIDSIIYNGGHECWYDLDWPINVATGSDASLSEAGPTEARTGNVALKINVVNGGGYGKVRVTNTAFYEDLQGADITLSVYAKSNNSNRIRFQLKVNYTDGSNSTFNAANEFTTSNTYQQYSYTYPTLTITSQPVESVEVRLQLGRDNGEITIDDWSSQVTGITLSTPIFEMEKIAVYPNPTSDYINISGPFVVTKAYLIDLNGRLVKKSIGDTERIDVSDVATGTYILKAFVEGNQHIVKKITIK